MAFPFKLFLFLAITAWGQQERIAIIQTMDDRDSIGTSDLAYLTDRLRETAVKVLPKQRYGIMTTESIVAFLGSQERAAKECREASCLAELGRKVNADYVAQARIGRFGKDLTIKTELYSSRSGIMIGSFTGNSKDIYGLLAIIDKNASNLFKELQTNTSIGTNSMQAIGGEVFTDARDGKKYRVVKIGTQIWMAENLSYNANGSKCYDNKPANCDEYGRLYDWNTAIMACPKGWHLPSKTEWEVLTAMVGGENTEGKHLKAKSGWKNNGNGLDPFGFSALPGGYGNSDGGVGYYGRWWSASEDNSDGAYGRIMGYNYEIADWGSYDKSYLFSVRCLFSTLPQ